MRCLRILACLWIASLTASLAGEELVLRAVSVSGEVTVDKTPLRAGDSIKYGQKIELGNNAGLKVLTVVDRSIFDFSENASVVFAKGDHVEMVGVVQLARGRARWAVHPKMVWGIEAQGMRYSLRSTVGAISVGNEGGQAKQIAATREGSVEVKRGEKKITTLSDIDRIVLEGKLEGEAFPAGIRAKRELIGGAMVRDWISASAIDDQVFLQSIQLGASETPRARGVTYQFLEPPIETGRSKRPSVAFDDPEHRFSARAPLYELNGSAMQVRRQADLSH